MIESRQRLVDDRYAKVMGRLNAIAGASALGVFALTAASVHDSRRSLLWVAGTVLATVPANLWITAVLLKKWGASSAETARLVLNLSAALIQNVAIGWPLPVWLWLPYVAVSYDSFKRRTTWAILGAFCLAFAAAALHDGVPFLYPVTFSALALFIRFVAEARLGVVRGMFVQSEEQRRDLDDAHARLKAEIDARVRAEVELRQSQKLEAVGRLAAGIAHEINTPLQYVTDSIQFVEEAATELLGLVDKFRRVAHQLDGGAVPAALARDLAQAELDSDVDYLAENVPKSIPRINDGLSRVADIVRTMKEFAHPDRKETTALDVNRALRGTLTIAAHEIKHVADVEMEEGAVPPIQCHAGEINQVFLNVIVNAAHAIAGVVHDGVRGRITIKTAIDGEDVVVTIADTGGGIPEAVRSRIFEPFFTTKEVGKGSGQGLAIARSVIQRHGGSVTFESEVGRGTTFTIRLPKASRTQPAEQAA